MSPMSRNREFAPRREMTDVISTAAPCAHGWGAESNVHRLGGAAAVRSQKNSRSNRQGEGNNRTTPAPPLPTSAQDSKSSRPPRPSRRSNMYTGPSSRHDGRRDDRYRDNGYRDDGCNDRGHQSRDRRNDYDDGGYRGRDTRPYNEIGHGGGNGSRDDYRGSNGRESRRDRYDDRNESSDSSRKRKFEDESREGEDHGRKRQHRDYGYQREGGQGRWRDDSRVERDLNKPRYGSGNGGGRDARDDRRYSGGGNGGGRGGRDDRRYSGGGYGHRNSYGRDDGAYGGGFAPSDTYATGSAVDTRNATTDRLGDDLRHMEVESSMGGEQVTEDGNSSCIEVDLNKRFPFGYADVLPQVWDCEPTPQPPAFYDDPIPDPNENPLHEDDKASKEDAQPSKQDSEPGKQDDDISATH